MGTEALAEPGAWTRRVRPAAPIPAAKPLGSVLLAIGVLLFLVQVLGADGLPWATTRHMPALVGFGAGVVICLGLLVLYWRFTLRFFLLATILVSVSASVGHLRGAMAGVYCDVFPDSRRFGEDLALVEEGLVAPLTESGVLSRMLPPIVVRHLGGQGSFLYLRIHADPRVKGLDKDLREYFRLRARMLTLPDGPVMTEQAEIAAGHWYRCVEGRFGRASARAMAARTAKLVRDPVLREAFEARTDR